MVVIRYKRKKGSKKKRDGMNVMQLFGVFRPPEFLSVLMKRKPLKSMVYNDKMRLVCLKTRHREMRHLVYASNNGAGM